MRRKLHSRPVDERKETDRTHWRYVYPSTISPAEARTFALRTYELFNGCKFHNLITQADWTMRNDKHVFAHQSSSSSSRFMRAAAAAGKRITIRRHHHHFNLHLLRARTTSEGTCQPF